MLKRLYKAKVHVNLENGGSSLPHHAKQVGRPSGGVPIPVFL